MTRMLKPLLGDLASTIKMILRESLSCCLEQCLCTGTANQSRD